MKRGALYRGGVCILDSVALAANPWTRLRGLLWRPALRTGQGLLIEPCGSVHTFGMRYPLDLVYLDRDNRVVDTCANLSPWRTHRARTRARKTLELPAGDLARFNPRIGEQLTWQPH